jgi:hypothetical protein
VHDCVSVCLANHSGLSSVPTSGRFEPVHYGLIAATECCSHTQDFQGSNLLWKQAALDGRILFLSSLNYSTQILKHFFKNGVCPLPSTSFPIHPSLTMPTAQQTGSYTKEIKVPIRMLACTLCRLVTEYTPVWILRASQQTPWHRGKRGHQEQRTGEPPAALSQFARMRRMSSKPEP